MGRALGALGAFCVKFRWMVVAVWVILAFGLTVLTNMLGATTNNTISLPGTGSQAATDLLTEQFPPEENGSSPAVYRAAEGRLDDNGPNQKAITQAYKDLKADRDVYSVTNPFKNPQAGLISDDGSYAFMPIVLTIGSQDLTERKAEHLNRLATQPAVAAGLESAVGGPIGSALDPPDTATSEKLGMLAAALILTLSFGSLIAMGMPLISAVLGLLLGLAGIWFLGTVVDTPSIGVTIARMIGLGVGIDYALFLVNRHRTFVIRDGLDPKVAAARAVATSGGAVVFAGGTVIIALVSLQVAGIPFIAALGFACATAVVGAVLAALTLLPALLAIIGPGIDRLRIPGIGRRPGNPIAARWAGGVTRHPVVSTLVAAGLLVPLAAPVATLQLGQADSAAAAPGTAQRESFDLMSAGFGPGYNGPLLIAVSMDPPATPSSTYDQQHSQAEALKKSLEQAQQELPQQQAELEQQQAELEAQGAQLKAEAAGLLSQESALQAQALQLRAQEEQLTAQADQLKRTGATLRTEADELVAQEKSLASALGRTLAEQLVIERLLADPRSPALLRELQRLLNDAQGRQQQLRRQIDSLAGGLTPTGRAILRQEERLAARLVANAARRGLLRAAIRRTDDPRVEAALQRDLSRARTRAGIIKAQLRQNLADLPAADRQILKQMRPLLRNLAEVRAAEAVLQRRIDGARLPSVQRELQRELAEVQGRAQRQESRLKANTAALRSVAEQFRRLALAGDELAAAGRALAASAAELAAEGVALEAEGAQLADEQAYLEEQAAALQAWAAELQAQAEQAQREQQQAEKLQQELTDELTAAGGDPRGTDPRIVKLQKSLATPADVDLVGPPQINGDGTALTMSVIADSRPASPRTAKLVGAERDEAIPAGQSPGMAVYVGGSTATNVDLAALIGEKLPLVILTVIGLSSLLLLIAFRSLLIPVQAAIANLLAAGASFGVVTVIFQWGWGLSAIGLDTDYSSAPVASYVPLMMFAALFGLSMDYQVFLMSTIQGEHAAGRPAREAVREGLKGSARVIITAALIMMSVFGSFIVNDNEIVKQFGVGLTAAVGFAAFMVLLFAPAVLTLFGEWTWRLPGFLDRLLPDLDLEGRALERRLAQQDQDLPETAEQAQSSPA